MKLFWNPWWTVLAGAIGTALGCGIFIAYILGIFTGAITTEYQWSRSVLASCVTCFFIASGMGSVWLGILISRYGLKRPTMCFLAIFGLTVAAMTILPARPWLFVIDFAIMGVAGAAANAMPYSIAICSLFDRHRGLALGAMVMGAGAGATLAPQAGYHLFHALGWRPAMIVLGGFFAIIPMLALLLLARDPPDVAGHRQARGAVALPSAWDTYLRHRNFWLIVLPIAGNSIAAVGITINLVSIASDRGVPLAAATMMLSISGFASVTGRLAIGWLLDRVFAPWIGAGIYLSAAAGTVLIFAGGSGAPAYIGAALIGICLGSEADLASYLVSRYFGIAAYSRTLGSVWVAWAWGGGIGSLIAGLSYDFTHSYNPALGIFVVGLLLSALSLLALPAYLVGQGEGHP